MSGNIKRLREDDAILVVIDMQERLVQAMDRPDMLVMQTEKIIKGFATLGLQMIFTQQYTKGLGETIDSIKEAAKDDGVDDFSYIEKLSYSAMGTPEFKDKLKESGKKQVVICGIEAHVCVLQTALDLLEDGYDVFIVANAVASRHRVDSGMAFRRVEEAGGVVTTLESILFEILATAEHPKFKAISNIVK